MKVERYLEKFIVYVNEMFGSWLLVVDFLSWLV